MTQQELINLIWSIANKLRGPYRPPQYRKVMMGNDEIFRRVMQDEQFRAVASAYLMNKVYEKARQSEQS